MTCNHAKINDSDWSDAANLDAADAGVEFFFNSSVSSSVDAHKCEKRVHNLTLDATQRWYERHIVNRP